MLPIACRTILYGHNLGPRGWQGLYASIRRSPVPLTSDMFRTVSAGFPFAVQSTANDSQACLGLDVQICKTLQIPVILACSG